jgi:hypothetical protein
MRRMRRRGLVPLFLIVAACGGSSNPGGPTPPPSTNQYRITITAAGASPKALTVPPGTRVLFINNDTRKRNMTSDPHPEHDICPDINTVGLLNAGQSRETGNLNVIRTCGYHDHDDPDNNSVKGTIVIK